MAVVGIALVGWSPAGTGEEPGVEELERRLEQRDEVIRELLERIEALERRTGIGPDGSTGSMEPGAGAADGVPGEASTTDTAPGRVVVDAAAAQRALERSLTQAGALLLHPGQLEIEPTVVFARDEDATPTFVTSGGNTFSGELEQQADSLALDVALRLGLPGDAQFEFGMPYRRRDVETVTNIGFSPVETSSDSGAALGDLRLGLAKTLLRENIWRPDLIGRITWDTDTGRRDEDGVSLGGGFDELRASLTAINRQDPVVFVGSVSYEHVLEDENVQPGDAIAASFGGFIALSPETSLRLLLSGSRRREIEISGSRIDGSDQLVGTFVAGGSTLLARGVLLDLAVGIGLTDDADDFSVSLSIPIRLETQLFR